MKTVIICPVINRAEPEAERAILLQACEVLYHAKPPVKDLDKDLEKNRVKNIVATRNEAREKALKMEADYFLWVDGDTVIPKDAVSTFTKLAEQGHKLLGGWYQKIMSEDWVAATEIDDKGTLQYFKSPMKGLVPVSLMGLGCMFMSREILEKITFRDGTDEFLKDTRGQTFYAAECLTFCKDAKELGFTPTLVGDVVCEHLDLKTKIQTSTGVKVLRHASIDEMKSMLYDLDKLIRSSQNQSNILINELNRRKLCRNQ